MHSIDALLAGRALTNTQVDRRRGVLADAGNVINRIHNHYHYTPTSVGWGPVKQRYENAAWHNATRWGSTNGATDGHSSEAHNMTMDETTTTHHPSPPGKNTTTSSARSRSPAR